MVKSSVKKMIFILWIMLQESIIVYSQEPNAASSPWRAELINQFYSKAIVPLVTAAFTFIVQEYRKRIKTAKLEKEKEYIIRGITSPVKVQPGHKRNSVMLLGLGGTGKTTLIRAIINDPKANPREKTERYDIYEGMRSWKGSPACNFYISDYKGQHLGTLFRSFIEQQLEPYSPMAYGYITSLIFMVDLVSPKSHEDDPDPIPVSVFDQQRVQNHLVQWNDLAIDAVFGLLTDKLRYVCVFINKADLMSSMGGAEREEYIACFDSLVRRVQKRCQHLKVHVVLGSAQNGAGTTEVVDKLIETGETQ